MPQNTPAKRPQIAVLANTYKRRLHTQHILDRILDGYGYGGMYHHPQLDVVSLFVEQRGEGDLTPGRAMRHPGMKVYSTVADALTRGTGKLAVEGVVYIGEQGAYPLQRKRPDGVSAISVLPASGRRVQSERAAGSVFQ
jgi:hypothetical protein